MAKKNQKKSKNNYRDRAPDYEDEQVRAWHPSKEEAKSVEDPSDIKIKIGNFTMNLCGFTQWKTKKGNKLMFAYKFKHEGKMIMYYIPRENTEEEQESGKKMLALIYEANERVMGGMYQFQDAYNFMNHIVNNQDKIKDGSNI